MDRRKFLATVGTGIAAAVAGCSTPSLQQDTESSEEVLMPVVPKQYREGWRVIGTTPASVSAYTLSSNSRIKVFEDIELRERVKKKTNGRYDGLSAVAFTSYSKLSGDGSNFASPRMISREVEPLLKEKMRDGGLENVSLTPTIRPVPEHPDANSITLEYTADFPTPTITKTINVFGAEREITINPSDVKVTALLNIWKPSNNEVFVAGGVFPRVNPGAPDWTSVNGGSGMGWLTGGFIDLIVDPDSVREDVIRIAENTQLPEETIFETT